MTNEDWEHDREAMRDRERLMGESNPDEWDPPTDAQSAGEINIMDPVLGEPVNVPGHAYDRPSDMTAEHARRLALRGEFDDLDDEQPLPLLSSSFSTDPVEGAQGSYAEVVHEDCPECPSEYGVHKNLHTMAGVHAVSCLLCNYEIESP